MKHFCSRCETEVSEFEVSETPDSYLYSCPACAGTLFTVDFGEILEAGQEERIVILDRDQTTYLLHLVNKQLDKVGHAVANLTAIKEQLSA